MLIFVVFFLKYYTYDVIWTRFDEINSLELFGEIL